MRSWCERVGIILLLINVIQKDKVIGRPSLNCTGEMYEYSFFLTRGIADYSHATGHGPEIIMVSLLFPLYFIVALHED